MLAPTVINGRLRAMMEASPPLAPAAPGERADAPDAADADGARSGAAAAAAAARAEGLRLKFIVNVSAMEGKFYRHKSARHPHTNMAKAALNMMTRTSAPDYAKSGIYMTAVGAGAVWLSAASG